MNPCNPTPFFANKNINALAKRYSSALGFIILILPKCPFCLVAYSSTITLCSATTLATDNMHHTGIGAYIALGMGIIITACILFTYKTNSYSKWALSSGIPGLILICLGIFKADAMALYYAGAMLLVLATLIYDGILLKLFETFKIGLVKNDNQDI